MLPLMDRQEKWIDPGIQSSTAERHTHIQASRLAHEQHFVDRANPLRPGDTLGRLVHIRNMQLRELVKNLLRNALDLAGSFSPAGFIPGEATPVLSREHPLDPSGVDNRRNPRRVRNSVPRYWFSHVTAPTRP